MRRILVPGLVSALPLLGAAGVAASSSILVVPMPDATPSIMTAGEPLAAPVEAHPVDPAADSEILAIGNSVVAVGADAIPPSPEEVSAISAPATPDWLAADAPLPLRGGEER
jgi:hypothetical protein